ncbi:MAG TPA: RHS repeat-associated core domain-containing protein [Fimbriimonadaceae bacterium]|nr:RHS repeat-associated core domain-containing protein [Fimbriimonadaceae bacterium]
MTEDYVYDDGDKLLEIKVGSTVVKDFDYDNAGRTTKIQTSAYTRNFSYDYESRVTQITGLATTNTFSYNGLDTRTKKVDAGGTSNFQRVGAYVTDAVVADGSAAYTPGVSERRSSTTKYLHAGLKNADLQTNSNQTNTGTRRYDAYGNVVGGVGSYGGPFGYAGKFGYQSSEDSGLMLLGHRYSDSSTGRFLTRDSLKDGRNWYSYCNHQPLISADPDGLLPFFLQPLLRYLFNLGIDFLIEKVWDRIDSHLGKHGSSIHKHFAEAVRKIAKELGLDDYVHVEVPYKNGKPAEKWRAKGSVTPDVAIGPLDRHWAVIDCKTGKQGLTRKELRAYEDSIFGGRPGLIIEVGRKGMKYHPVWPDLF